MFSFMKREMNLFLRLQAFAEQHTLGTSHFTAIGAFKRRDRRLF